MSHGEGNIKKFGEFMQPRRKWKMLDKLFIKGTVKVGFFKKSQDFEMEISFTNLKRLIIDIHIEGISPRDPKLKMDFIIGDSIDKAKEWCEKNGHVITHEINRTQL